MLTKLTKEELTENYIDDLIDLWHNGKNDQPLYEFLGMSRKDYMIFVESPDQINFEVIIRVNNNES